MSKSFFNLKTVREGTLSGYFPKFEEHWSMGAQVFTDRNYRKKEPPDGYVKSCYFHYTRNDDGSYSVEKRPYTQKPD